jgi:acetyl esterase/lipase
MRPMHHTIGPFNTSALHCSMRSLNLMRRHLSTLGHSGGSLCAIVALHAAYTTPRIPLTYQLLLLPVLDHTATPTSTSWLQHPHAPWLTPARILWYRSLYFNQSSSAPIAAAKIWNASPALAPGELLRGLPPTWIAVAGEDVLRGEAEEFANRLKSHGVPVRLQCYEGVGHSVLALSREYYPILELFETAQLLM